MPFRETTTASVVEAPAAEGTLRLEVERGSVDLSVKNRRWRLVGRDLTLSFATGRAGKQRVSREKLVGRLWIAREIFRDDLGIWISTNTDGTSVRRIFGVQPSSLLDEGGLESLAKFDRVVGLLRQQLSAMLGPLPKAFELGSGFGKVLYVESKYTSELFQRGMFGQANRRVLEVHSDGTVISFDGTKQATCTVHSRYGVTISGDYLRFADPSGLDLLTVAVPWISTEDRQELARRFGERLDASG